MEGAHQACVAGRAGASGLDGAGEGGHGAGGGGVVRRRGGLVEAHHISLLQPGGAGPPGLGHLDIGRLLQGQAHKAAAVGVQLHGVLTQQHPARGDGVAPLLKIQIPAEAVHDGQLRPQGGGQGGDGAHQPLGVEAPLLPVGQAALAVF